MSKRRAAGEGTIAKRPDGVWTGAIPLGYDANGKRKRRYVYARTQRECRRKLAGPVDKHIAPHIGRHKLDKLKPLHIQRMVTALSKTPGAATANKARRTLHGAMKQAVRWQLIPRNPVEAVDPVKETPHQSKLWTFKQTAKFLDAARENRLYAAFYLALATGLRRGELLGLFWSDLRDGQLRVQRNLTKGDKKGPVWTAPKTQQGTRIVSVPTDALDVLEEYRR